MVAVLGGADAGKSTLLGVLAHGEFDNGRGSARLNVLRHLHELRSGRTSSISHEILGFDTEVTKSILMLCINLYAIINLYLVFFFFFNHFCFREMLSTIKKPVQPKKFEIAHQS
jgi:GTPase SAR1 family protein